jgi:hypothetical protein
MSWSMADWQVRVGMWLLLGFVVIFAGCGSKETDAAAREIVFVCTETREVFHLPAQAAPALNPKTGKPTLAPGLYCAKCDKWFPTPPLDVVGGNPGALTCPVHHRALVPEGPKPASPVPDANP